MFSLFFTSLVLLPLKPALAGLKDYFSDAMILPLPVEDIVLGMLSGYFTSAFLVVFLSRVCGEVARKGDVEGLDGAVGAALAAGALSMTGSLLLRVVGLRVDALPFLLALFFSRPYLLTGLVLSLSSAAFGIFLRWLILTFRPTITTVNLLLFLFSFLLAPLLAFFSSKLAEGGQA